ncbi:dynein intermediate chain CFAP94, axonemal [Cheilinus undulatus]|uniref:dynein intermediate chain CFAP94, axonemal n=1 Tax=Cheilinus undulatus TaxID=241271 RepID=UPI001BD543F8|nr:dynein intermediate chain CFAP94, axonemal [Cheilinus undulatus]
MVTGTRYRFKHANTGKKPTKKQLARQREEEERRLREEEEARLQAEKDEQERLERERKAEELEKLELKDRGRRENELNELRHLLEENHAVITQWKTDTVEKAKWEKYMCCDGSPDPTVQQDINTYISLWRDDRQADITPVLQKCNDTLKLIEELEGLLRDVTDPQDRQKYQENLISLQELIHSKHQITTEEILKRASANIDTETGNMQTVIRDDNITLCLWANLKKNPRFKGLNFEEVGLGFELPKQLAVSNIAVRILHTHYDHLTSQARMAHLRVHTASHRSLADDEELRADVDVPEQEEMKEREEVTEEVEIEDEEVQSTQGLEERKSAASFQSRRDSTRSAGERVSQIQTQMEAVCAEGDPAFPPAELTVVKNGDHVVDLRQYTPLGGVFYYDVFHLPPQAHQMNGWDIREVLNKGLQVFPYPGKSSSSDENDTLSCPPVGVTVTLPETVIFLETPQVACWDAAEKQWRMDGTTDVSYEGAEAKMSFKMDSFKAFVLMQETYANFPFQRWELRPLDQNSALFTVSGALTDVSIMIKGNQCMLQAEQERGLSHLKEKWMSGPALQRAMLNAGINIFVDEYTDKYVSTTAKDPLTEHAAYEQMALFASACAFSWSKWNAKCGAEHLVMQVCEHRGPGPVPRDSWSLYLLGAQRSQRLEITESSEAFSPDHYPGSEFHSTFIHMLQDSMSADGITRTRESDNLFVDTIQGLLCATRPLMYA